MTLETHQLDLGNPPLQAATAQLKATGSLSEQMQAALAAERAKHAQEMEVIDSKGVVRQGPATPSSKHRRRSNELLGLVKTCKTLGACWLDYHLAPWGFVNWSSNADTGRVAAC